MISLLALMIAAPAASCCAGPKAEVAVDSCAICGLAVLKDTETADNRVEVVQGGKKTAYRCVLCALADVKGTKGDLTITAPSEKKGKPVKIVRTGDKWTAEPETATFVYLKGSHAQCEVRYRAITKGDAFDAYAATNPKVLKGAKTIPLAELVKRSE